MAKGIASGCIAHPGIEAVGRCKQCSKPFCGECQIVGTTGRFCSDTCKDLHEKFTERAQTLDSMKKREGVTTKLWYLGKKILFFAIILFGAAFFADYLGVEIPIVNDFIGSILNR